MFQAGRGWQNTPAHKEEKPIRATRPALLALALDVLLSANPLQAQEISTGPVDSVQSVLEKQKGKRSH